MAIRGTVMKHRLLASGAVAAFCLVAAAVFTTVIGAQSTDPHKQANVSIVDAEGTLRNVIGEVAKSPEAAMAYEGTVDRPGVRVYSFAEDGYTGYVDVSDGHVALLTVPTTTRDEAIVLSQEDAKLASDQFLSKLDSPNDGMDVSVTEGTGGGFPGYTVTYQRFQDGVALADYRVVEIDGIDGSLISLVDVRRDSGPLPTAAVTEAQADKIAQGTLDGSHVVSAQLTVLFDVAGATREVWLVALAADDPGIPGTAVFVDAVSGDLVKADA